MRSVLKNLKSPFRWLVLGLVFSLLSTTSVQARDFVDSELDAKEEFYKNCMSKLDERSVKAGWIATMSESKYRKQSDCYCDRLSIAMTNPTLAEAERALASGGGESQSLEEGIFQECFHKRSPR